jgi:hypothetical protein
MRHLVWINGAQYHGPKTRARIRTSNFIEAFDTTGKPESCFTFAKELKSAS